MKIPRRMQVWLFFTAVYGISALLVAPILLSGEGLSSPVNKALLALVTFVPSGLGILFVHQTRGPQERRDFWRRTLRWPRGRTKAALAGILILPGVVFASYGLASHLGGEPLSWSYAARVLTDWKALLVFLFVELTFGAFSEELGWRGYALDELQSRWGALASSLILGGLWAIWHTPVFLIPGTSQYAAGGLRSWLYPCFLILVTLGSVIHTWAYNSTNRSILVAGVLMHFSQNAAMIFLGGIFAGFSMPALYWPVQLGLTALVSVLLVLLFGARTLSRRTSS